MQNNKWNGLMTVQPVSGEWFIAVFQIMQESEAKFFETTRFIRRNNNLNHLTRKLACVGFEYT